MFPANMPPRMAPPRPTPITTSGSKLDACISSNSDLVHVSTILHEILFRSRTSLIEKKMEMRPAMLEMTNDTTFIIATGSSV